MRNQVKNPTRLVVALMMLLLPVAIVGSAAAQDDGHTKTVKVMVKKHVECDGDDCPEGVHAVHTGHGANVMVFKGDGEEGHNSDGRHVWVSANGQESDDHQVWVSSNGQEYSFGGGAFLGVQMIELTDALRNRFDVRDGVGVMVSEVVAGSPAEAAGIQAGDIITAVDGEEISGSGDLRRRMAKFEEGENVAFEVSSEGSSRVLNATLAKREPKMAQFRTLGPNSPVRVMKMRSHGGPGNVFIEECDDANGDCDVEAIIERVVGDHDDMHVIELDGVDFEGLDCGDSANCEIEVTCEDGDCVCTVDGSEVACGN